MFFAFFFVSKLFDFLITDGMPCIFQNHGHWTGENKFQFMWIQIVIFVKDRIGLKYFQCDFYPGLALQPYNIRSLLIPLAFIWQKYAWFNQEVLPSNWSIAKAFMLSTI